MLLKEAMSLELEVLLLELMMFMALGGTKLLTSQLLFLSMTITTPATPTTIHTAITMAAIPPPPMPDSYDNNDYQ